MNDKKKPLLALFYCQNIPKSGKQEKHALEKKYGCALRLFSIPCSGRLEPLHLLRALEEYADAAYVLTCPVGACRYFEGNLRVKKRVERTRQIIASIDLEKERIGIVTGDKDNPKSLSQLTGEVIEKIRRLGSSPVQRSALREDQERHQETDKGDTT
jgi:coenzyme F420-reducing hydrogenase delta subunit